LNKDELRLHHKNITSTSLVLENYSKKLIQYYHGEMLMLTMGLKDYSISIGPSIDTSSTTS